MEDQLANHFLAEVRLAIKRKGVGGLVRDILLHPDNQAIALYRVYRWLYLGGHTLLADLFYRLNFFICDVEINPDANIGPDFHLDHAQSVLIGRWTRIGKGVRICSHVAVGAFYRPGLVPFLDVRDYAQIRHGAMVGGNCIIGEFAQIGLNAVVLDRDIPPYAVVVGNPGQVVKIRDERVNSDDYKNYKYIPDDYTGPPSGMTLY